MSDLLYSISEIFSPPKGKVYYIPSYQRGYKWTSQDAPKFRSAILNMAESDNDIVYAFYNNNYVIHGKCGNILKCAFQAKLPINSERILSVRVVPRETLPYPDISLGNFR